LHRIESTDVARVRRQRCVTKPSRHAANAAHGRPRNSKKVSKLSAPRAPCHRTGHSGSFLESAVQSRQIAVRSLCGC
jgi:hypothetical protein